MYPVFRSVNFTFLCCCLCGGIISSVDILCFWFVVCLCSFICFFIFRLFVFFFFSFSFWGRFFSHVFFFRIFLDLSYS